MREMNRAQFDHVPIKEGADLTGVQIGCCRAVKMFHTTTLVSHTNDGFVMEKTASKLMKTVNCLTKQLRK